MLLYWPRIFATTRLKRPEAATSSSCTVGAGTMGGAACSAISSVSPSQLCFVNTKAAPCPGIPNKRRYGARIQGQPWYYLRPRLLGSFQHRTPYNASHALRLQPPYPAPRRGTL